MREREAVSPGRRSALRVLTALAAQCAVAGCTSADPADAPAATRADPLERLPADGPAPRALVLGLAPFAGVNASGARVAPLASYLTARLGLPVTLRVATDYAAMATDVRDGRAQVALLTAT